MHPAPLKVQIAVFADFFTAFLFNSFLHHKNPAMEAPIYLNQLRKFLKP